MKATRKAIFPIKYVVFSRAISKNKEGVVFLENQERAETGRGRVLPIGT
jgi:hypothetical protein